MDRPYVEGVRVEDYRCIKAVELRLTPLHALIGPNDSGKSSLLRALRGEGPATVRWVAGVAANHGSQWSLAPFPRFEPTGVSIDVTRLWAAACHPAALLRLDPDTMRGAVALMPAGSVEWFADEKGRGLAGLYDLLLSRDRDAYSAVEARFRALFPTVRTLRLDNASGSQKTLGLTLSDGKVVGPEGMSEGMLYWLAFAIIEHLAPQAMILIEEPENGLHPARIREVMKVLREVSQRTQIILATHSPLVVNELHPEEVTIVTRTPERGTICTPMAETTDFATRSTIYALGELWLSFADGDLERELVADRSTVAKAG